MTMSVTIVQIKFILLLFSTTFPMSYQNLKAVSCLMLLYRGRSIHIFFSAKSSNTTEILASKCHALKTLLGKKKIKNQIILKVLVLVSISAEW